MICKIHKSLLSRLKKAQVLDKRLRNALNRKSALNKDELKAVNGRVDQRNLWMWQAEQWIHGTRDCFGCHVNQSHHHRWSDEMEKLCLASSTAEQEDGSVLQVVGSNPAHGSSLS